MWWIAGGIVTVSLLGVLFVLLRRRGRPGKGPVSVVLLQSSHRPLTEADVRGAARRVFNVDCQVHNVPLPGGEANGWALVGEQVPPLFIIDARRGYFEPEEVETIVARFEHPETREAIRSHRAWLSVDAAGDVPRKKEIFLLQHMFAAKLAAEFYDQRCMLLYAPALGRAARATPGAESLLKQGDIGTLFLEGEDDHEDVNAQMINVQTGDSEVAAAKAEAQRRLPELISAFERLGPDASVALFKASFPHPTDPGAAEIIWMKMTEVADAGLRGTIENHPIRPDIPKRGSVVTVSLDRIVDWAYVDEDKEPHGMFVERVLKKKHK